MNQPQISWTDLSSFNKELLSLVESGLPIDLGFSNPRFLGKQDLEGLAEEIQLGVAKGESIPEVLKSSKAGLPSSYIGIVQIGISTSDLPGTLRIVALRADTVKKIIQIWERILIYPAIVFLLGFALYSYTTLEVLPNYELMLSNISPTDPWLWFMRTLRSTAVIWIPGIPILFITLLFLFWRHSRKPGNRILGSSYWPWGWNSLLSYFCELLALLVEKNVPLKEAVPLVLEACSDQRLSRILIPLVNQLETGIIPNDPPAGFPPFAWWLLKSASTPRELTINLRIAARRYQRNSERWSSLIHRALPLFCNFLVLTLLAAFYLVTLLYPGIQVMKQVESMLR